MARAVLGAFTVDTERDADLIARFEREKAEGKSQSDLFRDMGRVYLGQEGQLGQILQHMRFIIDELAEIKRVLQAGVVIGTETEKDHADGMDASKHNRLRDLGRIE